MSHHIDPLTKFLLPLDGSESCERAIKFSGCLAGALGERVQGITLLHVLAGGYLSRHMANVDVRTDFVLKSDLFQRLRDEHVAQTVEPMLGAADAEFAKLGVKARVNYIVLDGDPSEQITVAAKEGDYSTILMGRRGLSGIKERLLGSVTANLLHRGPEATVYVAGTQAVEEEACPIPRLLVAVDGSPHAVAAVHEAAVLAQSYGTGVAEVVLLRVIDVARYREQTDTGLSPEKVAHGILHAAQQILSEAGVSKSKVVSLAKYGRPVGTILEMAKNRQSNIILMGRRGRSALRELFMGSVSSGVLHQCVNCTVAVVGREA